MDPMLYLIWTVGAGLLALLFAWWKTVWIKRQDPGTPAMVQIAGFIRKGALAFLYAEYRPLAVFVLVVAVLLALANQAPDERSFKSPWIAASFLLGALSSMLAGYFGMRVATLANVRTAAAARRSLNHALQVAFSGGSVMGMCVVGLALFGLSALFALFYGTGILGAPPERVLEAVLTVLPGFSLGASSIALFARVGGGIYTKAADVGADLVGKVDAGIPEDDPRNPAVIADNVGDNEGDVAGMGADLFESYVGSLVGAMVIAAGFNSLGLNAAVLPLVLAAAGIAVSILGTFLVRTGERANPQAALNGGVFGAAAIMTLVTYYLARWLAPGKGFEIEPGRFVSADEIFWATVAGLIAGILVGVTTEYYCSTHGGPVQGIVRSSTTGPATNIIAGLSVGFLSSALPVVWICLAIGAANYFAGLYGIAIAAVGMLSTIGIQLSVDAYGPISDNAGGIAEMAGLPKEVRRRTDKLDAVGNTTAAIGKGFAIGSAALTALALFAAFRQQARIGTLDLTAPNVLIGLFLGAVMPFVFSAMAMRAVGDAAVFMVEEVRRQFQSIPGLLKGRKGVHADYERCVAISTKAAIRKMMAPGVLAVAVPVAVGFLDKHILGGVLAGVTVSGVLLAVSQANAGGAWDNAKKYIEEGHHGGKGSPAHKAAVIGDTVGDPLKDTSGPSLNILVKLMAVVSLVIAPLL